MTSTNSTDDLVYRLVDFGDGRKLESLGGYLIDRPSPAAQDAPRQRPAEWSRADAVFEEAKRQWRLNRSWPDSLALDCGGFAMPVRPTPFGHIGLFPEQQENWRWLAGRPALPGDLALNLFGYTGAATLALASAGYTVAHVDAAKPNVVAAGEAARFNGWDKPPIRYLVDDAAKFVARERRRQKTYHTITLDPPAYGHSPKGNPWRIERDLWPMLDNLLALLAPDSFRLLVTGHSPEVDHNDVVRYLQEHPQLAPVFSSIHIDAGRSQLQDASGRSLDTGFVVRAQLASSPSSATC